MAPNTTHQTNPGCQEQPELCHNNQLNNNNSRPAQSDGNNNNNNRNQNSSNCNTNEHDNEGRSEQWSASFDYIEGTIEPCEEPCGGRQSADLADESQIPAGSLNETGNKSVLTRRGQTADRDHHHHHHHQQQQQHQLSGFLQPEMVRVSSLKQKPAGEQVDEGQSQRFLARLGSRRRGSARRAAAGSSCGRPARQVRFQPIPQSIDISVQHEEESEPDEEGTRNADKLAEQNNNINKNKLDNGKTGKRRDRNNGGLKGGRAVQLAAKPLARKLRLLKLNRIRLKSFSVLTHQLQSSLLAGQSRQATINAHLNAFTSTGSTSNLNIQANNYKQSEPKQLSTEPPQPITCSSDANANEEGGSANEDDFGWGSDFDEHSLGSSSCPSEGKSGATGCYQLQLGGHQRAIADVIHDQGTRGLFKRLELEPPEPVRGSPPKPKPKEKPPALSRPLAAHAEPSKGPAGVDKRDKGEAPPAEQCNLEPSQGFRQIKNKLKIILDQRLAHFDRSPPTSEPVQACQQPRSLSTSSVHLLHSHSLSHPPPPPPPPPPPQMLHTHPAGAAAPSGAPRSSPPDSCEDCQSHCSDESGLGSNHSGSQDSGHSTGQHSSYSGHALAGKGPNKGGGAAAERSGELGAGVEPDSGERRSRFLQNRLIINSKLESMLLGSPERQRQQSELAQSRSMVSVGLAQQVSLLSLSESPGSDRTRLLEQQRQMSLKLKQKPRRKASKQVMSATNCQIGQADVSSSSSSNGSHEKTGSSTADSDLSGSRTGASSPLRSGSPEPALSGAHRRSLTKQLSMVCLRAPEPLPLRPRPQLRLQSSQCQLASHGASRTGPEQPLSLVGPLRGGAQAEPKAAVSLRQLVKDVIDDCERPSQLSLSLLNRSDSSSSELAASADDLTASPAAPAPARPSEPASASGGAPLRVQASPRPVPPMLASPCSGPFGSADQSLSSLSSTIDGLEYSRASSICISPTPAAAPTCKNARTANGFGFYLRGLRDLSRLKLPKVSRLAGADGQQGSLAGGKRLAMLGRNLFTDRSGPSSRLQVGQQPPDASQQKLVGQHLPHEAPSLAKRATTTAYNNNNNNNSNITAKLAANPLLSKQPISQRPNRQHTCSAFPAWGATGGRAASCASNANILSELARSSTPNSTLNPNKNRHQERGQPDVFANHFVTISNRKWKSCHLRSSLMQLAFPLSSHNLQQPTSNQQLTGQHLHQPQPSQLQPQPSQPSHANRMHGSKPTLSYLDNSRNFTDDDSY